MRMGQMEINQQRIEDAVIAEVAAKVIGDDAIWDRAKSAIDQRINKHFVEKADAQIAAAIEESIKDGFDREYQRVTNWGEPKGTKTTIRLELEKLISGYWNQTVDKSGKPDSNSYGDKFTRAEWLMTQMVASDFQGSMKQHVINLGGSLKDALRKELHETTNRLLHEVFHVKSADDQKAGSPGRSCIDPAVKPIA